MRRTRIRARATRREGGAAIITALLVMALSAILVSGILWREQVQVRRVENQRLLGQAQWVARGALDWTRLVLHSEADTLPSVTYLGGLWSTPVARTRLSDFIGAISDDSTQVGSTWLSGTVEDAQSRFNLRSLVSNPSPGVLEVNVTQLQTFQRLLQVVGVDGQLAGKTALYVRAGLSHSATRFENAGTSSMSSTSTTTGASAQEDGANSTDNPGLEEIDDSNSKAASLLMTDTDALLDIPGYTPAALARLRPFITVLPNATPVNMNTASAEVLTAMIPQMTLAKAQAFVARRQTVFFRNMSDVSLALQAADVDGVTLDSSLYDVNTSYFLIHGGVQHDRAEVDRTTLVWRDPLTHATRVVRVQDQP
ncbi:general secretion pathway protein K [Paraburkholderia bannensis]|uniref:Type II secretion system protein K n=1 Tax=Paraburkholderia bannensis TaxID=765414 RepID=A0A7W9U2L6_9BURK|nr:MULTISPECIES: type II secretion system minor pseudopilin GspK [Paraburkholderia]MBB3260708.1 general secretion pathway protein K [Paraburkholderia sp. WP4_3_2]MBB6105878.1 general secretion pathway protein K [Paraburkholderia bannensis]